MQNEDELRKERDLQQWRAEQVRRGLYECGWTFAYNSLLPTCTLSCRRRMKTTPILHPWAAGGSGAIENDCSMDRPVLAMQCTIVNKSKKKIDRPILKASHRHLDGKAFANARPSARCH